MVMPRDAEYPLVDTIRVLGLNHIEEGVAFVPGSAFYDDGSGLNTMRLNFSNATPGKIEEGVARPAA